MKILFTLSYVYPYTGGGIQTFISQLKTNLEERGHSVDVLALHPNLCYYYLLGKPILPNIWKIHSYVKNQLDLAFPTLQEKPWIYGHEILRYCFELTALQYGVDDYDIIYAHDVISAFSINRIKSTHTPLVMSTHGFLSGEIYHTIKNEYEADPGLDIQSTFEYQYFKNLEDIWYHSCQYVHVPSQWTKNILISETSINSDKIVPIPYGIDHRAFFLRSIGSCPLVKPAGKKVILFAGRLVSVKGVRYLIEALGYLQLRRNDWECWIAGDGELKESLMEQVRQLNLNSTVKFLGNVDYVAQLMRQSDIFVLPGLQDTQPHVVMEAQLMGLPVIVSDAAGLPEMVAHAKNGFIFPSTDSFALCESIESLLANPILHNQFSTKARVWAQRKWSLTKMTNQFIDLFNRAIAQNNGFHE